MIDHNIEDFLTFIEKMAHETANNIEKQYTEQLKVISKRHNSFTEENSNITKKLTKLLEGQVCMLRREHFKKQMYKQAFKGDTEFHITDIDIEYVESLDITYIDVIEL